jgi:hypothetical protein
MFRHPVSVRTGEVVERDGFVFADLLPADERTDLPQRAQRPQRTEL